MQFCTSGYVNAFGVYQDFYTRGYLHSSSTSTISWIGSMNNLLVFGGGLIFGRIFDAGYFRWMLHGGTVLFIFCLFMISITQEDHWYQLFLAQGIGLGLAQGLLYLPSLAIVGHHFKKKRTLVMGIVATGASVGGIIHPIMLNQLFEGKLGFHNGVRVSAAMNGFLLIIANIISLQPGTGTQKHEKKEGDDNANAQGKKFWLFFKEPAYATAVLGNFLFFLGGYFPLFYLQLSGITHGVDQTLVFYSIAIMNAANFVGRVLPNQFAHRLGVHNQMIVAAAICGALAIAFIGMKNAAGVVLIALIYGFASGAYVSLLAPMLAGLSPNVQEMGNRMGTCFALGGLATFIGPPIMGALLGSSNYQWYKPSLFSGICVLVGVLFMIVARGFKIRDLERKRQNGTQDVDEKTPRSRQIV
ncbi:major facilitator superfamily domain-containing protein [Irpex lacteus]|nr:major facilitator superfamily domain-containing protein [Irpex lacteus]